MVLRNLTRKKHKCSSVDYHIILCSHTVNDSLFLHVCLTGRLTPSLMDKTTTDDTKRDKNLVNYCLNFVFQPLCFCLLSLHRLTIRAIYFCIFSFNLQMIDNFSWLLKQDWWNLNFGKRKKLTRFVSGAGFMNRCEQLLINSNHVNILGHHDNGRGNLKRSWLSSAIDFKHSYNAPNSCFKIGKGWK